MLICYRLGYNLAALNTLIDIAEEQGIRIRKKIWGQAVERLSSTTDYTVEYSCDLLGRSKQAYYKKQKHDQEYLFRVIRIVDAVKQIREMDPGIGYYKLWLMMKRMFWQRAEDRNRATAKLYDDLGLACYEAMEAFVEYKF